MPDVAAGSVRRPQSPRELFRVFQRMAMQGFGGVLPIAQHELVERERWLTQQEFLQTMSIGQVLPGPNIVNMALIIGNGFFGWRGAAACVAGLLGLPLLIVLLLAAAYGRLSHFAVVAGALHGMGAVAAGLVIATALKIWPTQKSNPLGLPLCSALTLLTLLAVGALRWPMVWVVLGLGALALALAWRKLAP